MRLWRWVLVLLGVLFVGFAFFMVQDGAGTSLASVGGGNPCAEFPVFLPIVRVDEAELGRTTTPFPTATPCPTSTSTATSTVAPSDTATSYVTGTSTPLPYPTGTTTKTPFPTSTSTTEGACATHFEFPPEAGDNRVNVSGVANTDVIVYDVSVIGTPPVLGTAELLPFVGHGCSGFFYVPVEPALYANQRVYVQNTTDGTSDEAVVGTPVPTGTILPTSTLRPSPTAYVFPGDLAVNSVVLVSTPPIVAYEPIDVAVEVENVGTEDIPAEFFVDVFLDPPSISLMYSSGYMGVTALPAGASTVLTITAPYGFPANMTTTHVIAGLADSLGRFGEPNELNNVATLEIPLGITPQPSPTPLGEYDNYDDITGLTRRWVSPGWQLQQRTQVWLLIGSTIVAVTESDFGGRYGFGQLPAGIYNIIACSEVDGETYVDSAFGYPPPQAFVDLFMLPDPAGCPISP